MNAIGFFTAFCKRTFILIVVVTHLLQHDEDNAYSWITNRKPWNDNQTKWKKENVVHLSEVHEN